MSSRRRRSRRNRYLAGGAILVSAVLLMLAIGWYPLAIVNRRVIWASTYRSYVASALAYQQAAHDTYATSSELLSASAQGEQALGAVALDELIEQKLIQGGLEEKVGDNAGQLVQNKMDDMSKEPQLEGASRALFQLDPNAFNQVILKPQAMREVLSGRLYLDGKTLIQWTADARSHAKVRVLSSTYKWDGSKVQVK